MAVPEPSTPVKGPSTPKDARKKMPQWLLLLAAVVVGLGLLAIAIQGQPPHDQTVSTESAAPPLPGPAASVQAVATDSWVGTWTGVEGLRLDIAKETDGYKLHVFTMDGDSEYHGVAAGDAITFVRDGKTETIRAGDGAATGLKWLANEKNCLVIKEGEGFCRPL